LSRARAAFVDRDGVVNELVPDLSSGRSESPLRVEDVVLADGAARALRQLAAGGWLLVGVSNQPAAAKGTITLAGVEAVQARVLELLGTEHVRFDAFRTCLHHPHGVVPELTRECECRKPAPGMIIDAARELGVDLGRSWMIGDTDGDVAAGQAAGCRTVLIQHPASGHKRTGAARPDAIVRNLQAAVTFILKQEQLE
jgi:D-glycero-D-manno-heptose 1,7-bisphosphate phosphatase